jgi:hypothetical protein
MNGRVKKGRAPTITLRRIVRQTPGGHNRLIIFRLHAANRSEFDHQIGAAANKKSFNTSEDGKDPSDGHYGTERPWPLVVILHFQRPN